MSFRLSTTLPQSVFGDCTMEELLRSKDILSYLGNCSSDESELEKYKKGIGVKGGDNDITEMYKRDDPFKRADPRFSTKNPFLRTPW